MNIRRATGKDCAGLAELLAEIDELHAKRVPRVFKADETSASRAGYMRKTLKKRNKAVFLVEDEDGILGSILVSIRRTPAWRVLRQRTFGYVEEIVVKRGARRKRIGSLLMHKAQQWTKKRGGAELQLNVWDFNTPARAFFRKRGFREVSHRMRKAL